MEQYGEIRIPEIEEKHNRNKKTVIAAIIGCIVSAIVYITAGALIVKAYNVYNSDEAVLYRSLSNLVKEISEQQKLLVEAGVASGAGGAGASKTEISLNLSGDELPFTIGIDETNLRDGSAHKLQSEMELSIMNYTFMECDIYGDDERIVVSLPDIFEQNLEFSPKNVDKQYNKSLFAEMYGTIDETGLSFDMFAEQESDLISVEKFKELWEAEKPEESIQISKVKSTDKQSGYSTYRIVIPKEWIMFMESEIRDSVMEKNGVTDFYITNDIALLIDIEKNKRITMISLEEPMQYSVEYEGYVGIAKLDGSVSFLGENRSVDDMELNIETQMLLSMLDSDGESYVWEDILPEEEQVNIGITLKYDYNENDGSVTYDLDNILISMEELGDIKLTGEINVEPLDEKITQPKGKTIKIFEITEEEYEDLEEQLIDSLLGIMGY
ncbi:MAG: hypothetical protein NC433_11420 [Clostridiales bacterium]|nr:hypothetical protein [Clostridiales bacterium]